MRPFLIAGLIAATMAPALASAQTPDLDRDRDRHDVREQQRDPRDAHAYGDRRDVRDERRDERHDVREARQDYHEDWHDYRRQHGEVYRQGAYTGPNRGWRYRPVTVGYRFDPAFYGQRYWIGDPSRYRLPRPAGYQRWVRYGNDVVLVNTRNGVVVQVYNGFFF